jgi:hypothetical protein
MEYLGEYHHETLGIPWKSIWKMLGMASVYLKIPERLIIDVFF